MSDAPQSRAQLLKQITVLQKQVVALKKSPGESDRPGFLPLGEQLVGLCDVSNRLHEAGSLDELCRLSIQLGREVLGFGRIGIWLLDGETDQVVGSFGVDESGRLRDERDRQIQVSHDSPMGQVLFQGRSVWRQADGNLFDDRAQVVGRGTQALAALWDGHKAIGAITCDSLLGPDLLNEGWIELLRLFATTLGHHFSRLQATEALKASDAHQALILRSVPMALYAASVEGDFGATWVSDQIDRISGFRPPEFTRNSGFWSSRLHPDDRDRVLEAFDTLLEQGSLHLEYRWRRADGVYRWFLDESVVVHDDSGRPTEFIGTWMDITERRRLIQTMQESEERFRSAFDHNAVGRVLASLEGEILQANSSFSAMLGYAAGELVGRTFQELTHPDDLKESVDNVKKLLAGESPAFTIEKRYLSKNGKVVQCLTSVSLDRDAEGRPSYLAADAQDITDRQRIKEALESSRHTLRSIMDGSPAVIYVKDLQGRYQMINRQFEQLFDITNLQITGRTDHDVFPNEVADKFRANDELVLKHRGPISFEENAPHDDGPHTYLSLKFPMFDAGGNINSTCGISTDITDRKRAESALRESEARFRTVLTAVPDVVLILDAKGHYRQIYTSDPKLLAAPADELIDRSIHDILPEEIAESIQHVIDQTIKTDQLQEFEYALLLEEESKWFSARVAPFGPADDPSVLWVARDITEHMQAEQRAQQHQNQLAHVGRLSTLGEMASGLAHELNQPLTAIANYGHGCLRRLDRGELDEKDLAAAIRRIVSQSDRAGQIIRSMRSFARKPDPHRKQAQVNELIRDVVALCENEIHRSGVKLKLDLAAELKPIMADAIQIEQVVLNLIRNGLDAMAANGGEKGTLTIRTRSEQEAKIQVQVSDDGIGLTDESRAHMFDPFFTTKANGTGMGMGLTISHSIIESHGGRLLAISHPDRGTTFEFTLPCQSIGGPVLAEPKKIAQNKSVRIKRVKG